MNEQLSNALCMPMKHISDVEKCFSFCANEDDIHEVIGMIPYKFGSFSFEISNDGESFTTTNIFFECGEMQIEEEDYNFYKEVE